MATRKEEEGAIAASWGNQAAAGILRRAREAIGRRQYEFAPEVYAAMEAPFGSVETYGSWERSQRQVPAAAVIAAAMLANRSLDELMSPLEGRERFNRWLGDTIPGLLRKLAALEEQLREVRAHVGLPIRPISPPFLEAAEYLGEPGLRSEVDEVKELLLRLANHTGYHLKEGEEAVGRE